MMPAPSETPTPNRPDPGRGGRGGGRQLKPVTFIVLALTLGTLVGELLLGYALWSTEHNHSTALGSVVTDLWAELDAMRSPPKESPVRVSYEPRSPYRPDPELGFANRPGVYTVTFHDSETLDRHAFRVTIDADGRRVTAAEPERFLGKPEVWIFGDSFVFGWGNDDDTTFPFFLQRYLPDRRVVNHAVAGYGNLHGYLQFRRELDETTRAPEAVVVAYADYLNERNVASQMRLATFRFSARGSTDNPWSEDDPADFTHPRARLRNGRLEIDRVPLLTASTGEEEPDLEEEDQYEVTSRILAEMLALGRQRGCRMVLAFLDGRDTDPVMRSARAAGYEIADLRPDMDRQEWDNFYPLDNHPGPKAQSVYAWKLFRALTSPRPRRRRSSAAPGTPRGCARGRRGRA